MLQHHDKHTSARSRPGTACPPGSLPGSCTTLQMQMKIPQSHVRLILGLAGVRFLSLTLKLYPERT